MKLDLTVAGFLFANNKVLLILHGKLNLWLPVGGHIDDNETPDQALRREVKEETNLDIKLFSVSDIPVVGNIKENLAAPFYVNVHSVGDHDHCNFYYVCKVTNPESLQLSHESKDARWFSKEELNQTIVPIDVKNQALKAFDIFEAHS